MPDRRVYPLGRRQRVSRGAPAALASLEPVDDRVELDDWPEEVALLRRRAERRDLDLWLVRSDQDRGERGGPHRADLRVHRQRRRVRPLPHSALGDPRVGEDRAAVRRTHAAR